MNNDAKIIKYSTWYAVAVFCVGAIIIGGTVAGPGLSWDEPAYRHSQVTLQNWLRELREANDWQDRAGLFSKDSIQRYWEYNRFGHNFHPPMGGYLNLLSYAAVGRWWDDISARRLASGLEFAAAAAMLCHFLGKRYGVLTGLFSAGSLLTMPRLVGDAHVIGTDMPMMFFWAATALTFYRGLTARRWQWVCAASFGCLFLVKFSGVVIVAPMTAWLLVELLCAERSRPRSTWLRRWLVAAVLLGGLMLPVVCTLLWGIRAEKQQGAQYAVARWGMGQPYLMLMLLTAPLAALGLFYLASRAAAPVGRNTQRMPPKETVPHFGEAAIAVRVASTHGHPPYPPLVKGGRGGARASHSQTVAKGGTTNGTSDFRSPWPAWLEFPLVLLAVTPLVALALNPTWWHETVPALARFFDLNLNREAHLPNINIFYLGRQYVYSLPWHNAFVLMAVTIPFGTLLLGLVGCVWAVERFRVDRLPAYFLLQALTLPAFRMLPTPAHDGVRLFLPTFFFWSGLAGLAAAAVVNRLAQTPAARKFAWAALFTIGPGWAFVDWVRVHPFELSYYNAGLRRAVDWGFEPTYWYDAVTPAVLRELNDTLPKNVPIGLPDPLINPEVFGALQELGRLRADVQLDLSELKGEGFPWLWLLTHSSKATAFTRLLYACPPWHESGHAGARLFSVVDSKSAALAWALHALTVDEESSKKIGSLKINYPIFAASAAEIRRSIELVTAPPSEPGRVALAPGDSDRVRALVERWRRVDPSGGRLGRVLRADPAALERAIRILTTRGADVRAVLEYPGYLRPERFGGYLE